MNKDLIQKELNEFIRDNPGEDYRSIAKRAGIDDSSVWRMLAGERIPTSGTYGKILYGMKKSPDEIIRRKKEVFPDEFDYLPDQAGDSVVHKEEAMKEISDSIDLLKTYLLSLKTHGLADDDMLLHLPASAKETMIKTLLEVGAARELNNKILGENIRTENNRTNLDLVSRFVELARNIYMVEGRGKAFSFSHGLSDEGVKQLEKVIKKFKKGLYEIENNPKLKGDMVHFMGMTSASL